MSNTLHLVLKHEWYDEILSGRKTVEYRAMTPRWAKMLWEKRGELKFIRFARGYSAQTLTREIELIDIGPCPYPGWPGDYYRVHLKF